MGFKEVASLDCDTAIQLGGINKKTGKANPTRVEGYYIGSRDVDSPKSKTGVSKLHIFQTEKGTLGVWGKTDLDRKLSGVTAGHMTRVTFTGMKETKNNPMYVFKVEVDSDNSTDVSNLDASAGDADADAEYVAGSDADEYESESDVGEDEPALDEAPPARPSAPRRAAATPNAAQQDRIQAMVNGRGKPASRNS